MTKRQNARVKTARTSAGATCIAILIALGAASCRGSSLDVTLEPTPVLSDGPGWGLVGMAYSRLKSEPRFESADCGYVRRGEVLELLSRQRSFDGADRGTWYRVKSGDTLGWLHESAMEVHGSRERAVKASESRP